MRLDSRQCNGQSACRPLSLFLNPLCVKTLYMLFPYPPPPPFILMTSLRQIALNTTVIVLDVNVHVSWSFLCTPRVLPHKTCVTQCKIQRYAPEAPNNPLSRTCVLYCNRNKRKQYRSAQKLCILMQNFSLSLFYSFVSFLFLFFLLQFVKFCFMSGICFVFFIVF